MKLGARSKVLLRMEKNEQETPSLLFSKNVFYNISDTLFDHLPIVYICRNNVTTIRRQNYGTIKPICKEYKLKKRVVSNIVPTYVHLQF